MPNFDTMTEEAAVAFAEVGLTDMDAFDFEEIEFADAA